MQIFLPLLLLLSIGCATMQSGSTPASTPSSTSQATDPCDKNCKASPEVGMCKGAITKFFFNPDTKACEEFLWGGCSGVVPFESLKACEECACADR